jgi:hypothetical protein
MERSMADTYRDLIVTSSSEMYRPQLLSLLGSLHCNWPDHPPVMVYDMGLRTGTDEFLRQAGYNVRLIPPFFVPHWDQHYTWKPWCMNDAPAERILWLDAGCCILRPCPEIFEIIGKQGYFAIPNYQPLEVEASVDACEGCGVSTGFPAGKVSLAANVFGFQRGTPVERVVQECLKVAQTERYIKQSKPWHRQDQSILSLLMYRDLSPLILNDGTIYSNEDLSADFTDQAIWASRRCMHFTDKRFFAARIAGPVSPHRPRRSHKIALWYRIIRLPKAAWVGLKKLLRTPAV